jgi:type II secretory pathway pseudopilin PulG
MKISLMPYMLSLKGKHTDNVEFVNYKDKENNEVISFWRMKRNRTIRNNGFALLEVVFAFAILELALLAIISAFPSLTKLNKNAWQLSVATQLAQEKMEEIKSGNRFLWEPDDTSDLKSLYEASKNCKPSPSEDNLNVKFDKGYMNWVCSCGENNEIKLALTPNVSDCKCSRCNSNIPEMLTKLPDCTRVWWGEKDPGGSSDLQVIKVKVIWTEGKMTKSITLSTLYYL